MTAEKVVCVCVDRKAGCYALRLSPSLDADEGVIELYLSAETQKYPAPIVRASRIGGDVTFKDNVISGLSFVKGQDIRLKIDLDYHDYCSMEVMMYAIKK